MADVLATLFAGLTVAWVLFVAVKWISSARLRRDFPGGPGRLLAGMVTFYAPGVLPLALGAAYLGAARLALEPPQWTVWAALAAALGLWALIRYCLPYTRDAALEWICRRT